MLTRRGVSDSIHTLCLLYGPADVFEVEAALEGGRGENNQEQGKWV